MTADFTGNWTADLSKSKFAGPPPAALRATIEHRDPKLRQELIVTNADGTEQRAIFECRTTGEEGKSSFHGKPIRGRASWTGDELIIESWMEFGPRGIYLCDCWSLSPDVESLVMEHCNDDLAGQRVVLVKVPTPRTSAPAADPQPGAGGE